MIHSKFSSGSANYLRAAKTMFFDDFQRFFSTAIHDYVEDGKRVYCLPFILPFFSSLARVNGLTVCCFRHPHTKGSKY